jgi:hypothetical protein
MLKRSAPSPSAGADIINAAVLNILESEMQPMRPQQEKDTARRKLEQNVFAGVRYRLVARSRGSLAFGLRIVSWFLSLLMKGENRGTSELDNKRNINHC